MNQRILFGVPPHSHVALAFDDVHAMQSAGYECYTTTYSRNNFHEGKLKKIFGTIKNAFTILGEIRRTKPQYLFLNSRLGPMGSLRDYLTVWIINTFSKRPPEIIIKSHGSDPEILSSTHFFWKRLVIPYLGKKVDLWLLLSGEEKQMIEALNPEIGNKSHVLPNIVAPERCEPTSEFLAEYPLPRDKFICFYAGRMDREKGIFDILECIPYLTDPKAFHFLFVGRGSDLEELKSKAEQYRELTSIQFTGFLPDAVCDQFYPRADVLLYPTYFPEGFPMALFKSVACGIPVITTATRAAKDHLTEPENTLWVRARAPQEIASALEKIYHDDLLRQQMSANNLKLGKSFSHERIAFQFAEILHSKSVGTPQMV